MSNKTLGELIAFLATLPPNAVLSPGFGSPHSDRGDYSEVAFKPMTWETAGEMLASAKSAIGKTFTGYKGGEFTMNEWTYALLGEWGYCGENINSAHFLLWERCIKEPTDEH